MSMPSGDESHNLRLEISSSDNSGDETTQASQKFDSLDLEVEVVPVSPKKRIHCSTPGRPGLLAEPHRPQHHLTGISNVTLIPDEESLLKDLTGDSECSVKWFETDYSESFQTYRSQEKVLEQKNEQSHDDSTCSSSESKEDWFQTDNDSSVTLDETTDMTDTVLLFNLENISQKGSSDFSTLQTTYDTDSHIYSMDLKSVQGQNSLVSSSLNTSCGRRRLHKFRKDVEIVALYDEHCCGRRCVWNFSPNYIMERERCLHTRNEVQLKQYILDDVHQHARTEEGKMKCRHMISGHEVCEKAYLMVYDVRKRRLDEIKLLFSKGVKKVIHGNEGIKKTRVGTTTAIAWMNHNLGRMGDYMPHNNKIYLPVGDTKISIYQRMCSEVFRNVTRKEKVSAKYFLQLWKEHFPEYIVGKPSPFAKCSDCIELKEAAATLPKESDRRQAQDMLNLHKKQAEIERRHYHTRRIAAQQNPEEWLTIIVDGMDQNKTDLPHFSTESKATSGLLRLKTHVTGVIVHTDCREGREAYAYIDVTEYSHDANLTMHVILDVLDRYKQKPSRKLHVQLDNCFRENKNKYVLSLGWMIVHLGIFDEVNFSFLPVGHTHENVDQMFSRISVSIKRNNIYTLDGLKDIIHNAYSPPIHTVEVNNVLDCKEWLSTGMEKTWGNHSKPLHFLFKKVNGETVMFYKKWVTDVWRPNDKGHDEELIGDDSEEMPESFSNGIRCMKTIPDLTKKPSQIQPLPRKYDIEELAKVLPKSYSSRIPEMYREWWVQFVEKMRERMQEEENTDCDIHQQWILQRLMNRPRTNAQLPVTENLQLEKMRKRMGQCDDVYVGKKPPKRTRIVANDEEAVELLADDEEMQPRDFQFKGELEVGQIVVVHLDEFEDEFPQIGEVIEICESNSFKIRFYAAMNGKKLKFGQKWGPAFQAVKNKRVPFISNVMYSEIKLHNLGLVDGRVVIDEDILDALVELRQNMNT